MRELAVRHVSVFFDGPTGEKFTRANLHSTAGNQGMWVPLQSADAPTGRTARAGASAAFLHVPPGNSLLFTVTLAEGPVPGPALYRACQVHYQGFLLDLQPAP